MDDMNLLLWTLMIFTGMVVGYAFQAFEGRPRMMWYSPPSFNFNVKTASGMMPVNTDGVTIQNTGRRPAKNVEIHLACSPRNFQIQPSMDFEEITSPSGVHIIRMPVLGAKEDVAFQVLYYDEIPNILQIRSDSGPAKHVAVWLTRRWPYWINITVAFLFLLGAGFGAFFGIRLLTATFSALFT